MPSLVSDAISAGTRATRLSCAPFSSTIPTIISKLYDQIKTVVDKTAEMNGYHIVFAYPDAVTDKEMNDPMVKELKLKPPAGTRMRSSSA